MHRLVHIAYRSAWVTLIAAFAISTPRQVVARTHPRRGAALKPRSFAIRPPFPCGIRVHVNCAYGPRCSPAHKRVRSRSSTNDYYALDFTRAEKHGGAGKVVVAAADGIVRYAGWARGGWAPYGKLVYIEHSYRDRENHTYQSLYAHLQRVNVRTGERISAGAVVGTLGGSSRHALRRFGPHLHFALYRDAGPTLGGGQAVVPEPMGEFEDLRRGSSFVACGSREAEPVAVLEESEESEAFSARGGLLSEGSR